MRIIKKNTYIRSDKFIIVLNTPIDQMIFNNLKNKTMKKLSSILATVILLSGFLISCGEKQVSNTVSNVSTDKSEPTADTVKEEMSEKKSTLMKLKGEHKLVSISGFMGANTMVDYLLENGKWKASGSSNMGGMREGYDIDLTKDDLKKLETMKIVVSDDLTVTLKCKGKEYFRAPFKEDGFTYSLKKSPKEYSSNMSEKLKANSTFIDDYLYLYAKDHFAETELEYIDIANVMADAALIKYNTKTNEFEMSLFFANCCGSSIYTFK